MDDQSSFATDYSAGDIAFNDEIPWKFSQVKGIDNDDSSTDGKFFNL